MQKTYSFAQLLGLKYSDQQKNYIFYAREIWNTVQPKKEANCISYLLLKSCAMELRRLRVKAEVSIPNQRRKRVSLKEASRSLLSLLMLWFLSRSD